MEETSFLQVGWRSQDHEVKSNADETEEGNETFANRIGGLCGRGERRLCLSAGERDTGGNRPTRNSDTDALC